MYNVKTNKETLLYFTMIQLRAYYYWNSTGVYTNANAALWLAEVLSYTITFAAFLSLSGKSEARR